MKIDHKPFAEVVASSLHEWRAECWQWDSIPSFGMPLVVELESHLLFGIVHAIETTSHDPNRMATAYQLPLAELKKEQPQLFLFLKSTFTCISIGYLEQKNIYYNLPPTPPLLHSFIRKPTIAEEATFLSTPSFLAMLFQKRSFILHFDELLLSIITYVVRTNALPLKPFLSVINRYYGNEFFKMRLLLERVHHQALSSP